MPKRVFIFIIHRKRACSILFAQKFGYFVLPASHLSITRDACGNRLTRVRTRGSVLTTLLSATSGRTLLSLAYL